MVNLWTGFTRKECVILQRLFRRLYYLDNNKCGDKCADGPTILNLLCLTKDNNQEEIILTSKWEMYWFSIPACG